MNKSSRGQNLRGEGSRHGVRGRYAQHVPGTERKLVDYKSLDVKGEV